MSTSIRVPLVEPGTTPALREIEDSIRSERGGEIAVLYQALLNSPSIASGWEKLLTAIRNRSEVPAHLRELIILRVAVLNRASFEFDAHVPHANKAGVSQEKLDAVKKTDGELQTLSKFSADEDLVLELTDSMTSNVQVPEELMFRIRQRFDPKTTVEIVATVAAYNMVSRFLVALNIVH
jgi:AhpD family alkylhydroperoxidase